MQLTAAYKSIFVSPCLSAVPLGLIMTSVEATLDTVRQQMEHFTVPDENEGGARPLAENWRFLESKITPPCLFSLLPFLPLSTASFDL